MSQPEKRVEMLSVVGENRRSADLSPKLISYHEPLGAASEAYRMLRTNLFYSLIDSPPRVIVVTSASPREGKSITCANLAVTLAQVGKSVLVLDCDLRRPVQHTVFGVPYSPGLVDILAGEQNLQEVCQEPIPGLKVVPAGHVPPNPAEILSSRRLVEFLVRARQEFDYVLVDTPPVRLVSDSAILARQGDGVLLVLDVQEAGKRSLRHAMRTLEGVGANVIGTVMNNVKVSRSDSVYGYITGYHGGS